MKPSTFIFLMAIVAILAAIALGRPSSEARKLAEARAEFCTSAPELQELAIFKVWSERGESESYIDYSRRFHRTMGC